MYNTSYIMQFYSDDGYASWHGPDKIISRHGKTGESSRYYISSVPGAGCKYRTALMRGG